MTNTATPLKPLPPTPKEKHWLFGSAYLLKDNPIERIKELVKKYGPVIGLTLPLNRVAIAARPEYARYVLLDNNKNYTKSLAYDMLKLLLGNGLLTSEGDFWKQQRKLIQPAFHKKKLESLTQMMNERAKTSVAKYQTIADSGKEIDMLTEMTALTLDIISKSIFSKGISDESADSVGKQITLLNQYAIEKINQPIRLPAYIPTPFNIRERKAMQILDDIIYQIIDQRKKEGVSKDDLLSMLIDARDEETGQGMDNKQLRDEVMTIFLAGNETSANALSWTLYLLSQNPEAERKLVAEIEQFWKPDGDFTFEEVNRFQYTRMVLEESMRLFPPAWSVGRRAIAEDEIGGFRILPKTNVLIPIIYFHHSPEFWESPEQFMPERFAPEKRNAIDRFVYFPFGGGPRLCIGNHFAMLEMQIVLIHFYKHLTFKLSASAVIEPEPLITLRPRFGMPMRILQRASA